MTEETRTIFFSVLDQHGRRLEGASVRFYVKDRLKAEALQQENSPIKFEISNKVEFVDVEMLYAKAHAWTKVSMEDGFVEFTLHDPDALTPLQLPPLLTPALAGTPNGNSSSSQEPSSPPWKAAAVWAAIITGLCTVLVGFWQYGPKSCSSPSAVPPVPSVKFRVKVLDYSNLAPVSNATVSLEDGASHSDSFTDAHGITPVFNLPKSNQANLSLSVLAEDYAQRSFNLDRPTTDETYTAELKPIKSTPSGTSSQSFAILMPGTWTVQGIGDPNNERITSGSLSFVKQGDGKAVLTGHLHLDNTDVALTGICEWHGHEAHMSFSATTAQGGSWQGSSDSARKLTGRLLSKRGDDVPLELTKD